jgi:hypothetical protein
VSRAGTDFAAFPRTRLILKWHRRQLISSLSTELRVRSAERGGTASVKIPDLGLLPDEMLEIMTPVRVGRRSPDGLFPGGSPAARFVELCDGSRMLGQIARALMAEQHWNWPHSLHYARGVFLYLVIEGLCLPKASATHSE